EMLGDVDVLSETLHRLPQMHFFLLERRVVLPELVLTVVERLHDRVEMLLRALVLAEVVDELVAERDQSEQLLDTARLGRVEVLDGAAQIEQRRRDVPSLTPLHRA